MIVRILYKLCEKHKAVKGFRYSRKGGKGSGTDSYPLVWVDDPILGSVPDMTKGTQTLTVNLDILLDVRPKSNKTATELDIDEAQRKAVLIASSLAIKVKDSKTHRVTSWDYVTLSRYTDDDKAGVRATFRVITVLDIDLCAEFYDEDKTLDLPDPFPDYSTEGAEGCRTFKDKVGLPDY